jgi:hypothetical protein
LNVSERENGQLPLAKRTARTRVSSGRWEQIKTAYASGIGLRQIARSMGIPAGTILARAKREGWSKQINDAKSLAEQDTSTAVTPFEAVSASMEQRGARHDERMAPKERNARPVETEISTRAFCQSTKHEIGVGLRQNTKRVEQAAGLDAR